MNNHRPTHLSAAAGQQASDRFFKLALDLMEGDVGASQETVKLMAQDSGLGFIKNLCDRQIPETASNSARAPLWTDQIKPFFQILTHERVVDSNVLEQQVAAIYNFTLGVGGRRMRVLFDFILGLLRTWPILPMAEADPVGIAACELSLAVLAAMVDCNTSNIVDDNFSKVVEQFGKVVQAASQSPNEFSKLQAQKYLQYLERRLGVGSSLAKAEGGRKAPVTRAEFVMRKDLPGQLSQEGPRHDNDHEDIGKIRILPTYEEITSIRNEYLPTTDPSLFHRPGIQGRLDREFRLLREDTVGQLRDAISLQLEAMRNPQRKYEQGNSNTLRTYAYEEAAVSGVDFHRNQGMILQVQFRQPCSKNSLPQRRDWWANSKRLQPGGLVCILSENGSVLFCVVNDDTQVAHNGKKASNGEQGSEGSPKDTSLADDENFSYIHLTLAETGSKDIRRALDRFKYIGLQQRNCLVEFPRVLLPSFQHTLKALQRMSDRANVPFDDLLASTEQEVRSSTTEVKPPQYTTKPGFSFNLTCLTSDGSALRHSPSAPLDPQELSKHSSLDETQSSALLNTLSRKLAIIQGPPGTGKSFTGEKIIKALLANKENARLGPILCVCYTNHALDQLLVHLFREKVKIIRIGSRSKVEELEGVNLRTIGRNVERTRAEKHSLWQLHTSIDARIASLTDSVKDLARCEYPGRLRIHLRKSYERQSRALFGTDDVDEDNFQEVHGKPNDALNQWLRGGSRTSFPPRNRDIGSLLQADVRSLNNAERLRLHNYWVREIRDSDVADILRQYEEYERTKNEVDKVSRDVDLRCLHQSEVVGVTTTGLARNIDLLQKLRCKVMLCEEAGEVLEAHTLTALLPSVEHAILIGDHLQLRPQIVNYDLQSTSNRGAQYSLDVSLFERLINPPYSTDPRLPFHTLETQRRMHPSVSELIRSTLYPSLEDGGDVSQYPAIHGMKKRLFWLHHESPEDQLSQPDPTTTSHTNTFEIETTVALVKHLVRQGSYGADDIAVITPYLGQLHRLRREMGRLFEISVGERDLEELEAIDADKSEEANVPGQPHKPPAVRTLLKSVRLATVDNFQGEEAKVVVVSLVRSNNSNKCGFLSTSNRINVLLSRAQHGMYLIGNANTYRHVDMWAKVLRILEQNGNIGDKLELQCPRHLDSEPPLMVSKADDFAVMSPEGGCIRPCDRRLACGHACIARCHHENLHNAVKCLEPCPRLKRGCRHPCRRVCGEPCKPKCDEYLNNLNITLACGHKVSSALCWLAQDPSAIVCQQIVKKTVPDCNHVADVPCHMDVTLESYRCGKMCLGAQACGHSCRKACHECTQRKDGKFIKFDHGICRQACGRKYTTCRHGCSKECHGDTSCPLCPAPCEVRCSHSRCSKKCHEPCAPCAEQTCASHCPHSKCTMPCGAPCDWVPCSKRCEMTLSCDHQCPSVCGETCPDARFCQTCCSEDIKSATVDFLIGEQYRDVNLDEDPCIFPDCGHFITMTNMDGIMDMTTHYDLSAEGYPTAINNASEPFSMDEIKVCPSCRGSLRNIARYGRIVRRAMLDEATKKFISWSQIEYARLANRMLDEQQRILTAPVPHGGPRQNRQAGKKSFTTGRMKQLQLIREWLDSDRYNDTIKLRYDLNTFIKQVAKGEQPLQRVGDYVQLAARERQVQGDFTFDETNIQHGAHLQATSLLLKCDVMIITDFIAIWEEQRRTIGKIPLSFMLHIKDCQDLAAVAEARKHPRQEAEARVYLAQFCSFHRAFALYNEDPVSEATVAEVEKLKALGTEHLTAARKLVAKYPGQTQGLQAEIESAEKGLRDAVFYNAVSPDEMRAVYSAMAREFSGTGHWYTCLNGHPFTVGECGMPMQQARCPECDAPVGGTNHTNAEGVQLADDIENLARGVNNMGIR
ncbi:hypothetical protein M426DRAFT_320004 [Hypoxylon sp. CI-4A]|nr:hypothetical protein M426DRAFT_320004 [Hypoxylon sp. CI-4A]